MRVRKKYMIFFSIIIIIIFTCLSLCKSDSFFFVLLFRDDVHIFYCFVQPGTGSCLVGFSLPIVILSSSRFSTILAMIFFSKYYIANFCTYIF